MPTLRALAAGLDPSTPKATDAEAAGAEAGGAESPQGDRSHIESMPESAPAPAEQATIDPPVPALKPPPPQRDATATLVDFRMPAAFAFDPQTNTVDAPAPTDPFDPGETPMPTPRHEGSHPLERVATPEPVVGADADDAEEFPGLEVEVSPARRVTAPSPEPGAVARVATPVPTGVAEILPLGSLSPNSPLRVARVIEPDSGADDGDLDVEIPSNPGRTEAAEAAVPVDEDDDRGLFEADSIASDGAEPVLLVPRLLEAVAADRIDLAALEDVDLDGRLEDVDAEEVEDISVSDVADLEGLSADAEVIRSGDMEAIRPDAARAAPPPLREIDVRFVLRPLSANVAEGLISVGDQGLTIGRSAGEVALRDDPFLSPTHARLTVENDTLFAEDLGSLNGTWLRVRTQSELRPGDLFRVGHQLLRLEIGQRHLPPASARDGTRRFGASWSESVLCLQQLGEDGQPRNVYYLTEQGARVGRHIADIVFPEDTFMSGTHAVIQPRGERAVLRDLSSRNGTWIQVRGRVVIGVGDALMLGQSVWRVGRPVA